MATYNNRNIGHAKPNQSNKVGRRITKSSAVRRYWRRLPAGGAQTRISSDRFHAAPDSLQGTLAIVVSGMYHCQVSMVRRESKGPGNQTRVVRQHGPYRALQNRPRFADEHVLICRDNNRIVPKEAHRVTPDAYRAKFVDGASYRNQDVEEICKGTILGA